MSRDAWAFVGILAGLAALFALAVLTGRHLRAVRLATTRPPDPAPVFWVGITRYEGADPEAAEAAFLALRDEVARIPGDVELMHGTDRLRTFKVV